MARRKLRIEYFAILRERAGVDGEELDTEAGTPAELFAELSERYPFPEPDQLKVAVNDEFSDWQAKLSDGDSVVFIPPVAGG
jgi:molybdopterin converting factor subunit 1